jgi:hypothetical protein
MVLFRTHQDTPRIRERFDFLQRTAGMPVVCAFDEGAGDNAGFADKPRLAVGARVYERLGLGDDLAMSWRCGDYCYYAARDAYPDVTHFWLVEYDVFFSYEQSSNFFARFAGIPEVDFLAGYVGPAKKWGWADTMSTDDGPIFRSFFPVTRISARAADHCLARRRKDFSAGPTAREWPNDEVFTATTLMRDGFVVREMNSVSRVYDKTTYNFLIPRSYERELGKSRDRLLHPVLDAQELEAKPHATRPKTILHAAKRFVVAMLDG